MLDVVLLAAGVVAILVAAFLRHLQQWSISPPLLGLVTGVLLGPRVLDVLRLPVGEETRILHLAARLLLAVALMAIALRYPLSDMRRHTREVTVLLLVIMPAMAAIMTVGAVAALALPLTLAFTLGAALSPTDPVLASGIVTGEPAERDIPERDRQVLSIESGLNDGLAMPLVIIAVALVLRRAFPAELGRAVYEVVGGVVIGALAGFLAGSSMEWARRHREISTPARELYTLVLAFFVLGLSGLLRTDGLLAVFVAGLLHSRVVTGGDRRVEVGIDESLNNFLVIPVFILLGAALPWSDWARLGWAAAGFVAVALLLRRLPVVLALQRPLRASWAHAVWLGWFGPIGVAALFYLGHIEEQGVTEPTVWAAGTMVIAVSTVVHGLTAGPARRLYRRA